MRKCLIAISASIGLCWHLYEGCVGYGTEFQENLSGSLCLGKRFSEGYRRLICLGLKQLAERLRMFKPQLVSDLTDG